MKSIRKQKRKEAVRGNATLDFALGFAVLWMLFSGVYQFGYAFYIYNALQTAVTDAAEYGSRLDYDMSSTSAYTTKLQNMVLYGDITAGTKAIVPNLTAANVSVSVNPDIEGVPTNVTISITGYTISAIFKSFSLNGKPRVTTKYFGQVTCSSC